jgi:lipid-binding SYLF domain-containing protein
MFKTMLFSILLFSAFAIAESKDILNLQIKNTINKFKERAIGGKEFLEKRTTGYLVIPNLYKAGFVVDGEYGEGDMVIDGNITEYYQMISASIGLQAGAQKRSLIIAFIPPRSACKFQEKQQMESRCRRLDCSGRLGQRHRFEQYRFQKDDSCFCFRQYGAMANLSIDGSVFSELKKIEPLPERGPISFSGFYASLLSKKI